MVQTLLELERIYFLKRTMKIEAEGLGARGRPKKDVEEVCGGRYGKIKCGERASEKKR